MRRQSNIGKLVFRVRVRKTKEYAIAADDQGQAEEIARRIAVGTPKRSEHMDCLMSLGEVVEDIRATLMVHSDDGTRLAEAE